MSTNAELKKIVNEFYTLYEDTARTTRTAAMANLPAGAAAPAESIIYGEAGRNTFAKEAAKLLTRAEQLINEKITPIKARVTASPSEDAVNAVTMLSLNKGISETDVDLLLEKYADNCGNRHYNKNTFFFSGRRNDDSYEHSVKHNSHSFRNHNGKYFTCCRTEKSACSPAKERNQYKAIHIGWSYRMNLC